MCTAPSRRETSRHEIQRIALENRSVAAAGEVLDLGHDRLIVSMAERRIFLADVGLRHTRRQQVSLEDLVCRARENVRSNAGARRLKQQISAAPCVFQGQHA